MGQDTIRQSSAGERKEPILRLNWEELEVLSHTLAKRIQADGKPDVLIGLQRGGLIPAVWFSHRLAVPDLLAFSVRRTASDEVYAEKHFPTLTLPERVGQIAGRDVIVVDDIVGSGQTLRAALQALALYGPARLRSCSYLVNRMHWEAEQAHEPAREITYIGQEVRGWAIFPWETPLLEGACWT